jgi:ribulose-phosphate 3-epimerase
MKIAPSILTADFGNLARELSETERAGVDRMHLDVMDGNFVPNLSFGAPVCAAVARLTQLPCEAHLMMLAPERYFADYQRAGMRRLIVHVETCPHLYSTLQQIRELDMQCGVALNPLTPLSAIEDALPLVDLALIMSVEPGFGGQKYIASATQRIRRLRAMLSAIGSRAEIEVDGGVNASNIREIGDAGADVVVVGSAIYNDKASIEENVMRLRGY